MQLGIEVPGDAAVVLKLVDFFLVEAVQDFGLAHAHGFEQDRGGHLTAAVDAHVEDVLMVEVKVEPRTAHGDDAAGVEHLAAGMRLAAVVLEDDAGERCNWLTMTRSVPLMMKVPFSVIRGRVPK